MSDIEKVIKDKKTDLNPIWIMRQAGRYLPEFREIRKKNTDFIKLCLNSSLSAEITLQPLKRFDLDAAIIFSDILILPYGLKQKVEFKKNVGPILGDLNLDQAFEFTESDFIESLNPNTQDYLTTGFTISMWVNVYSNMAGGGGPATHPLFHKNYVSTDTTDITLDIGNGNIRANVIDRSETWGTGSISTQVGFQPAIGQWNHISYWYGKRY